MDLVLCFLERGVPNQITAIVNPVLKMTQRFDTFAPPGVICAGSGNGAYPLTGRETL